MSGLLNTLHDLHQQHRERREERREGHHGREHHDGYDDRTDYGSQHYGERPYQGDDYDARRPQSYSSQSQGQGQGRGGSYATPSGPPPSAGRGPSTFTSQGGLDRSDYASDADIDRMVASGEFNERQQSGGGRQGYGYSGSDQERRDPYGRYDAPTGPPPGQGYRERADEYKRYDAPTGPPRGQGYRERTDEYERYDAPTGPSPGRGYQSQQSSERDYGSGYGRGSDHPSQFNQQSSQQSYGSGYGRGSDQPSQYSEQSTQQGYGSSYGRGPDQYGSARTQGQQYESTHGPPSGYGRNQGNAPAGGFSASRDQEERYDSGYGGSTNNRNELARRGEAASYNQPGGPGQGDRYAHLATIAQQHGDDDPELYRQATHGLQEKIQTQSRPSRWNDEDDYKTHVDAHRRAYGEDDHGPMDADAIGSAAAMEAFKQTAAAAKSSDSPAGAFQAGKAGGRPSSKPGQAAQEEEEEETATARGGASGGLQDKLMALAMSQAGKLFDKKNAGSARGNKTEDKAQAMQSAAATAMQLFTQYQSKGKLEAGDMSKVMGLAMNLL